MFVPSTLNVLYFWTPSHTVTQVNIRKSCVHVCAFPFLFIVYGVWVLVLKGLCCYKETVTNSACIRHIKGTLTVGQTNKVENQISTHKLKQSTSKWYAGLSLTTSIKWNQFTDCKLWLNEWEKEEVPRMTFLTDDNYHVAKCTLQISALNNTFKV